MVIEGIQQDTIFFYCPFVATPSLVYFNEKLSLTGSECYHPFSFAGVFRAQLVFDSWPFITRFNYKYDFFFFIFVCFLQKTSATDWGPAFNPLSRY